MKTQNNRKPIHWVGSTLEDVTSKGKLVLTLI